MAILVNSILLPLLHQWVILKCRHNLNIFRLIQVFHQISIKEWWKELIPKHILLHLGIIKLILVLVIYHISILNLKDSMYLVNRHHQVIQLSLLLVIHIKCHPIHIIQWIMEPKIKTLKLECQHQWQAKNMTKNKMMKPIVMKLNTQ